jgi:DtxR family manganese transport transcriptional regulator
MQNQHPSHRLRKTRKDHSTEIAEDYVELIADLIQESGACRVTELARRMGVSHVTASRTVGRLVSSGLATTQPHHPVELTPKGKRLATSARNRHQIVYEFLKSLGVSESTADSDAEGIEHHCSPETLDAMRRALDVFRRKR